MKFKKMKVVHIIFSFNTGGAENMLVDILNEQVKAAQVYFIIINSEINQNLLSDIDSRVQTICLGRKENSRNPWHFIKLNWLLLKWNPDIIHCHQQSIIKALFSRSKCILTIHSMDVITTNLHKYRRIFAISHAVKKDIERRSNCKPVLLYNGVQIDEIKKKDNFALTHGFGIVQVSRLVHNVKGQHVLLKAVQILVHEKKKKNLQVEFIGEGDSLTYLKNLAHEYELGDHVAFLGNMERKNIYNKLANYQLLVQPSLQEGFGLTIAEGMAAKIPVLISNIEGPMEVIGNGKFGTSFRGGNAQDCAEKIEEIMNNYSEKIDKTHQAYTYVVETFDIKNTAVSYLSALN